MVTKMEPGTENKVGVVADKDQVRADKAAQAKSTRGSDLDGELQRLVDENNRQRSGLATAGKITAGVGGLAAAGATEEFTRGAIDQTHANMHNPKGQHDKNVIAAGGDQMWDDIKGAGHGIKVGAEATGHGIKVGAEAVGDAIGDASKATWHTVDHLAHANGGPEAMAIAAAGAAAAAVLTTLGLKGGGDKNVTKADLIAQSKGGKVAGEEAFTMQADTKVGGANKMSVAEQAKKAAAVDTSLVPTGQSR